MTAQHSPLPPRFSAEGWDEMWERTLDHIDRHRYGTDVWRGRMPHDALGRRIVPELALRWRRRALVLALVWGLFTLFWFAIGVEIARQANGEPITPVPFSVAGVGATVVVGCLLARVRFGRVAHHRGRPVGRT